MTSDCWNCATPGHGVTHSRARSQLASVRTDSRMAIRNTNVTTEATTSPLPLPCVALRLSQGELAVIDSGLQLIVARCRALRVDPLDPEICAAVQQLFEKVGPLAHDAATKSHRLHLNAIDLAIFCVRGQVGNGAWSGDLPAQAVVCSSRLAMHRAETGKTSQARQTTMPERRARSIRFLGSPVARFYASHPRRHQANSSAL